jgi:hypothetical protein
MHYSRQTKDSGSQYSHYQAAVLVLIYLEHLQQITHLSYPIYFLSPLLIPYFVFLVVSAIAYYSMDRVEGAIPLHLSKREVYFNDYRKLFGIGNGIGNLLKHLLLPKGQFFSIGERYE